MKPAVNSKEYREFYRGTVKILISNLRKRGVNRKEDIEDIVQDTYIEAIKSWDSLTHYDARVGWLLTIGRRQFCRYLEKRQKHQRVESRNESDTWSIDDTPDSKLSSPDESLDNRRFCQRVVACLDLEKNEKKKNVLRRYYLSGDSLTEISESTGFNSSTVTTWLSRFRKKAQKELFAVMEIKPFIETQIPSNIALSKAGAKQ